MYEPYGFSGLVGQNRADTQAGADKPTMPGYTGLDKQSFADMRTPEDQIHWLYLYFHSIASTKAEKDAVEAAFKEIWEEFDKFKNGEFDEFYEQQLSKWVVENLWQIYERFTKQIFFGLTSDGYFCAYVPDSWSEIQFDTGAIYGTEEYGRLILRYAVNGQGVIDNTRYDASVMSDTIDSRFKAIAGKGLEYSNDQLNVKTADEITFGGVKLTHQVDNDTSDEWAVTADGVYAYAPSKAETTEQPNNNICTEIMEGVSIALTEISRSGSIVQFKMQITVLTGHTLNSYTNICRLPEWAGSGSGTTNAPTPFVFISNGGYLQSTKSISAGSTVVSYMIVGYNRGR